MKKKDILVTGGTGFIGANLVRRLVEEGYRPTLLTRKESNLWRIKDLLRKVNLLETNLFDYQKLKKDIKKTKPSHIFHLAVYGAYQRTQTDLNKTLETNIIGTANLLNVCESIGFDYFINTGSSSEYGLKDKPMKETDLLKPVNYYGITKVAVTLISNVFSIQNKLPIVTLRPFSPYGYFEDKNRFVPTLVKASFNNKQIKLSNPNYVRDFIFIEDLIDAYVYFLNGKKYYGQVFNIGSGKQTKLGDFVKELEKIIGKKINVKWSDHKSNQSEPKKWQADISKAKTNLGWQPKVNLNKGLKKTLEWFKLNLYRYE